MMRLTRTLIMLMALTLMSVTVLGQPIPTNVWTDFGSTFVTHNGELVPPGTVVQAYDPQNVLCGQKTVTTAGKYTMSVYGDDLFTAGVDEGCIVGDIVVFKIGSKTAIKLGPGSDVWGGLGPIVTMALATTDATVFDITITGPDGGLGEAGTTKIYTIDVYNNGNGVDLITLDFFSSLGWVITGGSTGPFGDFIGPGEHKTYEISVAIPNGLPVGTEDTLTVTAESKFSPSENFIKKITTTVDHQTDVDANDFVLPGEFSLDQNFPNPFNPETKISFVLEKDAVVSLDVFDILGRRVNTLASGQLPVGSYDYVWHGIDANGRQSPSGVYFYRLTAGEKSITRKMTLLK